MSMLTPHGAGGPRRPSSRRRRKAVRAPFVVLLVLALAGGGWWFWHQRDSSASSNRASACPTPTATASATPPPPVVVRVYNATPRNGLGAAVARGLRARGFRVAAVANDPLRRPVSVPVEVRHGPAGAAQARLVMQQAPGARSAKPDTRKDASVDFVIGARFQRLSTTTELARFTPPTPSPTPAARPSGC